ncbi:MAG: hypothetical protein B6I37_02805 [Desulfobacteraceae bacterium 4572_35.2]|nr:MAG: hypothetical protein B6I37_02805 [Desulfobacteraceae bacterium 4572_35.2]
MPETTQQEKPVQRLQVSPEVAALFTEDADLAEQMKVARGHGTLNSVDQVHALFLFSLHGSDELKQVAQQTMLQSSNNALRPVLESPVQHPRVLDYIARIRIEDLGTLVLLRRNPVVFDETWVHIFANCSYEILSHFCDDTFVQGFPPAVRAAVLENNQAPDVMKHLIEETMSVGASSTSDGGSGDDEFSDEYEDTQNINKQKMVLELGMAEKVKMAMTGDKEWRNILVKDSNKTVSSAVLKNPRITDGEILFLAQNRSSSEDVIREILLNREWLKNYAVRHALVMHPRTPLPKAIRFLSTMNDKDVRMLAKSRNVSSAIVNNCRRMIAAKQNRNG